MQPLSISRQNLGMHRLASILYAAASLTSYANAGVIKPQMVEIPGSVFSMGATVDRGYGLIDGPKHDVTVPAFALARYEVTLGEFRTFVETTGYVSEKKCNVYEAGTNWHIDSERSWSAPGFAQTDHDPVVCVSWADAQAYAAWLSGQTGETYRLPSEAEMEYVTLLGEVVVSHATANIGRVECCGGAARGRDVWIETSPVGSFPADRFGLHDIRGNVWEWQADCYHANYDGAPLDGTARTTCTELGYHSIRGGSYGDAGEFHDPRFRLRGPVDQGFFTVGFRLARDLARQPASQAAVPPAIAETLSSMLDAMRERDVAKLDRTLARSASPEIVYYWGETVSGRDAILQWHREWFAEKGWSLEPGPVTHALVDSRVAVVSSTMRYIKSAERQFRILISHELTKEDSGWKVARIQQTLLEGPK